MSTEKCFCHFMGYKVKDSTAQKLIEENKDNVFEQNKNERLKFWVGTEEEYKNIPDKDKENNCLYITTDDDIQKTVEKLKAECLSAISGFNQVLWEDTTGNKYRLNPCDCSNHSIFAINVGGKTYIGCKQTDGSIIVNGKYKTGNGIEITNYLLLTDESGSLNAQHNETYYIEKNGEMSNEGESLIYKIVGIM